MGNLLGLYGFWRRSTDLTKYSLRIWLLLLLVILAVVATGVARARAHRPLLYALGIAGAAGFVLALGDRGPTGPIFVFLFEHFPGFRVMREPEKFLALLALFYAVCFGLGVEYLVARSRRQLRALALLALLALPCFYTYRMLWGLDGSVRPSRFPSSWAAADRLMGAGPEKVLALPWHFYPTLPFAQGRAVRNPIPSYFRRDAIIGENLEVADIPTAYADPVSAYVSELLDRSAHIEHFGNLVAPIGVKYVVLVKSDDYESYGWLSKQRDLRLVMNRPDLAVFENLEPVALAYATSQRITVANIDAVISLSDRLRLTDFAIDLGGASTTVTGAGTGGTPLRLRSRSPVHDDFGPVSGPGYLVFAAPFDGQWELGTEHPQPNLGATNVFALGAEGVRDVNLRYSRWPTVRAGYLLAILAAAAAVLAAAIPSRRRSQARTSASATSRLTQ